MSRRHDWVPYEWAIAGHTLAEMAQTLGHMRASSLRFLVGSGIPFALGAGVGLLLRSQMADADASTRVAVAAGILAFTGILIGFTVTLMLFTGRIDRAAEMSVAYLYAYAARIRALLVSQATTLFIAVITGVVTLVWTLLLASTPVHAGTVPTGVVLAGLTAVCLARTFLLPFQIYELHETWLRDLLLDREQAHNAKLGIKAAPQR